MKRLLTILLAAGFMAACSDDDDKGGDYYFEVDWPDTEFVELGGSVTYEVRQSGYQQPSVSAPEGWEVTLSAVTVKIQAPADENSGETFGKITISGDEEGFTFSLSMNVNSGIIVGFEDVPSSILAVDSYGSNFYSDYDGEQYTGYTDITSGLQFNLKVSSWTGQPEFYGGGVVFSTFNEDFTTKNDSNQCSVYYKDPVTGNGGNNGSKIFGVVYVAYDMYVDDNYGAEPTYVGFADDKEWIIDHLWLTNTVYAALAIKNGNDYATALTYDNGGYFNVIITGYSASGSKTGSVNYYLADFTNADSPGISEGWKKVDLASLGKVNKLEFTIAGSDISELGYGLCTPKYFCIDDMAIRK